MARVAVHVARQLLRVRLLFHHYDGPLGEAASHAVKTFFITVDVCHTTITYKALQVWRCEEYSDGARVLVAAADVGAGKG